MYTSLNIQHLLPKMNEIRCHLSCNNAPYIFGMCETFLHANISDHMLKLDSYNFERKDRKGKRWWRADCFFIE